MTQFEILNWLMETDETRLEQLWQKADNIRREYVGDEIYIRGLCEISNICVRNCSYCGIHAGNRQLKRYRMSADEILEVAEKAYQLNYGTIVIQSGEDHGIQIDFLVNVIKQIKQKYDLAITLSLGEREKEELQALKHAGADRYLLRFETSDRALYDRIHPPLRKKHSDRIALLKTLRELGYEIGSGVMVGIPGQTYETLAKDIELFQELDLDMIGLGPYIPHPLTALARDQEAIIHNTVHQVSNTETMSCKVLALARIVCPEANIPSTTALSTIDKSYGRSHGLTRGANVIMPNLTHTKYRKLYEIYPDKTGVDNNPEDTAKSVEDLILFLGRKLGRGKGFRVKDHKNL